MTQQPSIVVPLLEDLDEIANPYQANKPWQTVHEAEVSNAGNLFFQPAKETKPDEDPGKPATSAEGEEDKDNHDYKKRWVDLKNHYDAKQEQWKEKFAEAVKGDVTNLPFKAPKTLDELAAFKEENSELYSFMESIAHQQSIEQSAEVKDQLSEIGVRERRLALRQMLKDVMDSHDDFNELKDSEDFHAWVDTQPLSIQKWVYKNPDDSSLLIRAIDLYKADVAKIEANVESSNRDQIEVEDAASLVSTKPTETVAEGGPKIWTQQEVAGLTPDQYDRFESEIDLAISEGRMR